MDQISNYTDLSYPKWVNAMNELGSSCTPFFFLISYDKTYGIVQKIDELGPKISLDIKGKKYGNQDFQKEIELKMQMQPCTLEDYVLGFEEVSHHIHVGNSFLTNLTFRTPIKINASLAQIYGMAKAPYKLLLNDQFTLFSPESFVQIKDGNIYSFPMKGTIDADLPHAEQLILEDEKELSEHYTIVDLIRNDLSMVSDKVTVKNFRYIDHIRTNHKNLLQVSSEICGCLPQDYKNRLGNIFDALLPAGSICGAPKKKTCEIIASAETHDRGYYTGVFGIFDGEQVDSAVCIRFIEKEGNNLYFRSGGGITSMSNATSEYKEMIDKIYIPI